MVNRHIHRGALEVLGHACKASSVVLLATIALAANAADITAPEMEKLQSLVKQTGLVRVMVTLDRVPMSRIAQDKEALSRELNAKAESLYAELGKSAFPAGRWTNNMGQIGFYTDAAGLKMLSTSSSVVAFAPDPTDRGRAHAYSLDGSLDSIEQALNSSPTVSVDLVLNTAEPAYSIQRNGSTKYLGPSEVNNLLDRVLAESYAKGIQGIDRRLNSSLSPIVTATIDREAFYGLRDNTNVRAIRIQGSKDKRQAIWPEEALVMARKVGKVEVAITLRGGTSYSLPGHMPAKAYQHQVNANSEALNDILKSAGIEALPPLTEAEAGLGMAPVVLTLEQVTRLYANRDVRILSVNVNKGDARTTLLNSTGLLNMPQAWTAGYRGAGQTIVVLDSGVRKTHRFLQAGGSTRVVNEGCFGTSGYNVSDDYTYTSICPSPDLFDDSPVGLSGSGLPYSNAAFCTAKPEVCTHGTQVAGVSAGKANPSLVPATLQGVANDASLVAVQVFSYRSTVGGSPVFEALAFRADTMKALTSSIFGSLSGPANPYVVNISIASITTYGSNCNTEHVPLMNRIAALKSMGVPVVIATGNKGIRNGIGYPACLPGAIKVASVGNDSTGSMISDHSNLGPQASFTGAIFLAPGGNENLSSPNTVKSSNSTSDTAVSGALGTSIAAPHVTGAYAALKSVNTSVSVDDATAWISSNGVSVNYTFPGGSAETFKRVKMPNL